MVDVVGYICKTNIVHYFWKILSGLLQQEPFYNFCICPCGRPKQFLLITAVPSGQMMQYFLHHLRKWS